MHPAQRDLCFPVKSNFCTTQQCQCGKKTMKTQWFSVSHFESVWLIPAYALFVIENSTFKMPFNSTKHILKA